MRALGRAEVPGRASGVLLHPTSLAGPYGSGELGEEAERFVGFLREAGQTLWQVLPLGPTDAEGSPYSSPSAFAGNPLLVSTDRLVGEGLLREGEVAGVTSGDVDYAEVFPEKMERLRQAFSRWRPEAEFETFRERQAGWLPDYTLFMALKERYEGRSWTGWPEPLAFREAEALQDVRRENEREIRFWEFVQWRFFRDWGRVKSLANRAGVRVVGDVPIFISHDSADVWANQGEFYLDERGEPTVVAGVPPDYFSETGQLWGNPLYRWDRMERGGYRWWVARIEMALTQCDLIRLDHFRGFEAYWEVEAGEETAESGRWVAGPGEKLFERIRSDLGDLPMIAEDLGDISDEVRALREKLALPGMKVLQFGFSGPENPFLPHNYRGENWAVYTGTHDNDTTEGWLAGISDSSEGDLLRRYTGRESVGAWDVLRLAHASTARWSIVPMQDLLGLGSESRMNTPGTSTGNWRWRMPEGAMSSSLAEKLRDLTEVYGRTSETDDQ